MCMYFNVLNTISNDTLYSYIVAPKSIPVNLGSFTGKLSTGSLTTALFQEDKKNKATPGSEIIYYVELNIWINVFVCITT